MKRIKVVAAGLYGAGGAPISVGSEHEIESAIPEGWKTKVVALSDSDALDDPAKLTNVSDHVDPEDKEAVIAAIKAMDKKEIIERLDDIGWNGDKRSSLEELQNAAINALYPEA